MTPNITKQERPCSRKNPEGCQRDQCISSPVSILKVQSSLVQLWREAPYIWDDFFFFFLLLLFTQTYSICHGNVLITCMCVIYMSWCGGEWQYKYVLCCGVVRMGVTYVWWSDDMDEKCYVGAQVYGEYRECGGVCQWYGVCDSVVSVSILWVVKMCQGLDRYV